MTKTPMAIETEAGNGKKKKKNACEIIHFVKHVFVPVSVSWAAD